MSPEPHIEQQLQGRWVQNGDLLPGAQVSDGIHLHSHVTTNIMVLLSLQSADMD